MIGKRDEIIAYLMENKDDKTYELKAHREKRSLTANAYAWVLIGKIADLIGASKEETYLIMLKRYGQSSIIAVRSDIDLHGFIKYFEPLYDNGDYKEYIVYKGSSEYDTREMAVLIDGIVSECKELNIETLPPDEIERLKSLWNQ